MQTENRVPALTLVKGDFPLTVTRMTDGNYLDECHRIPGLLLFGDDLEALREEARIVGPILLRLNAHLLPRHR